MSLSFNGRLVGEGHKCFIIAEIGQNHQGDLNVAKQLITVAKDAGADCVKFQKSCLTEKFTEAALSAPYTSPNAFGKTYGEHKEYLEFSDEEFSELKSFAESLPIMFTASAMDPVSVRFLAELNVPFIKIGSGDSTNLLLFKEAALTGIPLVISTELNYLGVDLLKLAHQSGMQTLEGVKKVWDLVKNYHNRFAFLHCVSSYPTLVEDANLRVIQTLQKEFPGTVIGYSGHEVGLNLTLASVALGAKIVERHITLDKTWKGSDHCCSLEPNELRCLIHGIREIEIGLGNGKKQFQDSEYPVFKKLGKVLTAAKTLLPGVTLLETDIKAKVTGSGVGLPPDQVFDLVGKTLIQKLEKDEIIHFNHVDYKK